MCFSNFGMIQLSH